MTLFEALSILVSLVAAWIAVVALVRGNKITARQLELEEKQAELAEKQLSLLEAQEKELSEIALDVVLERDGSDGIFVITNTGAVPALNVECEIKPDDPIFRRDLEEKLPIKELRPGKSIELKAAFTMGCPTKFEATLSWDGGESGRKRDKFELHL